MAVVDLPRLENISQPEAWGYRVAIDGILYRVALERRTPLTIEVVDPQPQRVATEANPEDFVPAVGLVWSLVDVSGGEGLAFAHRRSENADFNRTRFWQSSKIAIGRPARGELPSFTVTPDSEQVAADANTNLHLTTDGSVVLVGSGSQVTVVTDPAGTPSINTEDPSAGTQPVAGLTRLGDVFYAALGSDGVAKRESGVWSSLSATQADGIWAAKGRILVDSGGQLNEIDLSTGTPTAVGSPLPSGSAYTTLVDAGAVIYAATSFGTVRTFEESSGVLTLIAEWQLSDVDVIQTMVASPAGVVLAGSHADGSPRLWRFKVGSSFVRYTPEDVQLIREWTSGSIGDGVAADDLMFFPVYDGSATAVWRFDLVTGGLSSNVPLPAGTPVGLVHVADRLFGTVETVGVYRQSSTLVSSGWLVSPMVDFFTATKKLWSLFRVTVTDVTAGAVHVYATTDPDGLLNPLDPNLWKLQAVVDSSPEAGADLPLLVDPSRYLALRIDVYSNDGTNAPKVQSVQVYASPVADELRLQIPVLIADRVERPGRRPFEVPGLGEALLAELLSKRKNRVNIELWRPRMSLSGIVEQVQAPVENWEEYGLGARVALVTVRAREFTVGAGGNAAVGGGWGLPTWGSSLFGKGA